MQRISHLLLLVWMSSCACGEAPPAPPDAVPPGDEPARTTVRLLKDEARDLLRLDSDLLPHRELLQAGDAETTTLHDLLTSENEGQDVSALHPEERAQLERYLQSYRALHTSRPAGTTRELDPETRQQLEQLGYLQSDG
jgi:hypothetical protein